MKQNEWNAISVYTTNKHTTIVNPHTYNVYNYILWHISTTSKYIRILIARAFSPYCWSIRTTYISDVRFPKSTKKELKKINYTQFVHMNMNMHMHFNVRNFDFILHRYQFWLVPEEKQMRFPLKNWNFHLLFKVFDCALFRVLQLPYKYVVLTGPNM